MGLALILLLQQIDLAGTIGDVYVVDIVAISTLVAMLGLWLSCRTTTRLGRAQAVFLVACFAAWVVVTVLALLRLPSMQPAVLITGMLLGFAIIKPPTSNQAAWALDLLSWTLVALIILTLSLEIAGFVPSWYDLYGAVDLMLAERDQYWIPLADILGLDARWAGPFIHPGRAGEVGALLLVWGVTRTGVTRMTIAAGGVLTLLVAGSRTAYIAAAVGLAVIVAVGMWKRHGPRIRWIGAVGGAAAVVVLVAAVMGSNMGMTGRASIWPTYLRLWVESPLWGAGRSGISAAQREGLLPTWAYHAHNLWLDVMTRHGTIVLALVAVAFASAVTAAIGDARRGRVAAAGVIAVLVVSSLTHTLIGWSVPDVPLLFLVLVVLKSGRDDAEKPFASGELSGVRRGQIQSVSATPELWRRCGWFGSVLLVGASQAVLRHDRAWGIFRAGGRGGGGGGVDVPEVVGAVFGHETGDGPRWGPGDRAAG